MDNGSANATMLECARVLAQHRGAWQRGLRLCFWSGHSHGRYSGSSWYVDNHWDELERCCAVPCQRWTARAGWAPPSLSEAASAPELAAVLAKAIGLETGQPHDGKRNARNSDMSFWGIGIPSMLGSLSHQPPGPVAMRNALGWWWHTEHDLLDKVDQANLVRDNACVRSRPMGPADRAGAPARLSPRTWTHCSASWTALGAADLAQGCGVSARQGGPARHLRSGPGAHRPRADAARRARSCRWTTRAATVSCTRPGAAAAALARAGPDPRPRDGHARLNGPSPKWTRRAPRNRMLHALRQAGRVLDAALG